MERNIMLLIIIAACLYLILDEIVGNKKYLSRFVQKTVNVPSVVSGVLGIPAPNDTVGHDTAGNPITMGQLSEDFAREGV